MFIIRITQMLIQNVLFTSLFVGIQCITSIKSNEVKLKKANILFVVVDDLRSLADENINLPHLKKLAGSGIYFKNAFAQQSLCAPSRNSILTGRRPDSLRLYDFYSYWRSDIANFTTIPQLFKENGYDTYSIGKVFHPGKSSNFTDDYPYSWSNIPYHPPTEKFKDAAVCKDAFTKKMQKNLICPVNVFIQPGRSLPDLQTLDYAINVLKMRKVSRDDGPFFMAVGFHKPHIPLKFPREYLGRVRLKDIELPKVPFMPPTTPTVAWHPWTDIRRRDDIRSLNISFPFGTMPTKWTRKIKRGYIAASIYVDDIIGELMSYVDTRNTVVVLTSDHGWSLGENGLWAKYSNFDVALKVPLIFKIPKLKPKAIEAPVELIDIFPTLVHITNSDVYNKIPKCINGDDKTALCFEGKSLASLLDENTEVLEIKYVAISQYPRPSVYPQKNTDKPKLKDIRIMGYSIRTKRHRYTEWISFNNTSFQRNWNINYGIELYDHWFDPIEAKNVFLDPNYEQVQVYLSQLLRSKVDPEANLIEYSSISQS